MLATVRHAATDDPDPAALAWAVRMAVELQSYLWASRHTVDWLDMGEALTAAVENSPDLRLRARLANQLGVARWSACDYGEAIRHFNHALELNTRNGHTRGVAANLGNLAALHRITGRLNTAAETAARSLDLYAAEGEAVGWANTGLTVAMVHADSGEFGRALAMCRRVLTTYRDLGSVDGEASALLELSRIYGRLGRSAEAVAAADAVLQRDSDALSTTNRASAVASLTRFGRPNTAAHLAQLSRFADELATTIGDRQIEAEVSLAAGVVATRLGRHDEALDRFRHARRLSTEIGDVHMQIDATCGAAMSGHRSDPDPAHLDDLRDALELADRNGLRICAGDCLATRAILSLAHGDRAAAVADARAASAIRAQTGMTFGHVDGTAIRRLSGP